jgi:hypothetical protein
MMNLGGQVNGRQIPAVVLVAAGLVGLTVSAPHVCGISGSNDRSSQNPLEVRAADA